MARSRNTSTPPARRARGSLSPEEILDATSAIVSRDGFDALSMPALGRELGSGVTSIYWYFRTKDELVVELCKRAMAGFLARLPPPGDGPWDVELLAHFRSFHEELGRIPGDIELLSLRPRAVLTDPAVLELFAERIEPHVANLIAAGATPERAVRLYGTCWTYTHGFALLQHAAASDPVGHTDIEEVLAALGDRLRTDELPRLARAGSIDALTDVSPEEFERGLVALIAGIRRNVAPSPAGAR